MMHQDPAVSLQIVALLPRLRRFARALAASQDDADDLVQAACEKALARLHQFEPGSRLDSWMLRIVHTTFLDDVRARQRRGSGDGTQIEDMEADGADARVHEHAEARSDLAVVRAEIARLPEEQRTVLALTAVDGLSYQQAADIIGIPIGTVMSRLARARRKLAAALEAPAKPQRDRLHP